MKKTLIAVVAILAMTAMACQNMGKGGKDTSKEIETQVRQRVEQMMQMDADVDAEQLLTADLLAMQKKAQSVHYCADYFWGFQWDLGVMDACSNDPSVNIVSVKPIDSLHCDVDMRYVDGDCYNEPYTLNMKKENGVWKIDDVVYADGTEGNLRRDCQLFYDDMVETYSTYAADEIMELLQQEEPWESCYIDPSCLYFENPDALRELIDEINNCHELFKQNPGYTEEYGKQINEMVERIAEHI